MIALKWPGGHIRLPADFRFIRMSYSRSVLATVWSNAFGSVPLLSEEGTTVKFSGLWPGSQGKNLAVAV